LDECEERTASGDVTEWAIRTQSMGIILDIEDVKDLFRYHGLARGVFHLNSGSYIRNYIRFCSTLPQNQGKLSLMKVFLD